MPTNDKVKKKSPSSATQKAAVQELAIQVVALLAQRYPTPQTHLYANSPWELLVAVILSAQCTDERVNKVTPELFRLWPTPAHLAEAPIEDVEACIRSTGFFRNKAKNIVASAQRVSHVFGGEVPATMADLLTLPGVARKTANVVLWTAYGKNEGIAVDTHVSRITQRLGLCVGPEPEKVERELMALFPQEEWGNVNHRLVWFGRHVCDARKPLCDSCEFAPWCPRVGVGVAKGKKK